MKGQWLEDCKKYYLRERLSGATRKELEEMLSGMGKEARKRIHGILESNDHPGAGTITH